MSNFAMVISCLLNPNDTNRTSIILDTVNDDNVNLNSTLTIHPIANGDMLGDHMFNNPSTLSFNGSFSLNGSKAIVVDKENISFQETQDLFEKIKKEGILCDIVKVQIDNEKDGTQKPRFKTRRNMALTNILWTEKINTLSFSFTFQQVLIADVETVITDPSDGFLPNVTEPKTLSFTETFIDLEQVETLLIKELKSYNLITEGFLAGIAGLSDEALVGGAIAIGGAIALGIVAATGIGAVAAIGVFAISAIVTGILGWVGRNKGQESRYRIEKFQWYEDAKKNNKEVERFEKFVNEVYNEIKTLDNKISAYSISSNEPQECLLSIDGQYYDFLFERSGSENPYSLKIKNMDNLLLGQITNIEECPEDTNQAASSKLVFKTKNTDTYLMSPVDDKKDLSKYYILSTKVPFKDLNNAMTNIIKNAILK